MNDAGLFRQDWDDAGAAPPPPRPRRRHDGPAHAEVTGPGGIETVPWGGWPPADGADAHTAHASTPSAAAAPSAPTGPSLSPAHQRAHTDDPPRPVGRAPRPVVAPPPRTIGQDAADTAASVLHIASRRAAASTAPRRGPELRTAAPPAPEPPPAAQPRTAAAPASEPMPAAELRTAAPEPPPAAALRTAAPVPPPAPAPSPTPEPCWAPESRWAPAAGRLVGDAAAPVGTTPRAADAAGAPPTPTAPESTQHALTHDALTRPRRDTPRMGWRAALHRGSRGLLNPGVSEVERARRRLCERVRRPVLTSRRIAVISVKGGIGKTTTAACLGSALAEIRGDQVCVVDANPDAGTLADRLTGDTSVTIRDLLRGIEDIATLSDVARYMSAVGRLGVLASDQDPAVSDALTAAEYETAIGVLGRFFSVVITDAGTGISHPTMEPTLRTADSLVVVGGPTVDGASRAGHTLDWLESHGYAAKARNAVVVLSGDRTSRDVDAGRIASHFASRVRSVVTVPQDPHLAAGGRIEFDRLRAATRDAYVTVAAHIADQFPDRAG
ncbi:chromosome partitioning ATPase [Pseudonocardia dioxanivorans CB1190]|uniref:Chromosome partitioning ATPase n=1 Tax=Pseudonocardia dioxanivorans (strain ATCC 55486 / DSM 44775 / JCM 13855 / CB1190) TaxID=675635 RepID=F4CWI4_PSEUX|nr:MinD/ParA family protein [Pseudonocardia dioxanivorans]AEA28676.1 chromosome partitioning ATPase [Pseudonocardia dioxanivorans CB1190]